MNDRPQLAWHWYSPLILVLFLAIPLAFWGGVGVALFWLIVLVLQGRQASSG